MGFTTAGKNEITGLVSNLGSKTAFSYLAVGSGSTAFAKAQTTLVTELTTGGLARAAATTTQATVTDTNDTIQFVKVWSVSGAGGTVRECGVFNAASTGTLGSRYVFDSDRVLNSGSSYSLTVRWVFA